jgi:hypothetical protein
MTHSARNSSYHPLPTYIAHADWGLKAAKRQVAVARLLDPATGQYGIESVEAADPQAIARGDLRIGLGVPNDGSGVMLGFDFPLGLPRSYAERAHVSNFLDFINDLGEPPWEDMVRPAEVRSEIGVHRPFYPYRPGGTSRQHLTEALGLSIQQLRRVCEGADAGTLFWTLGSKQVGKAAISGWVLLHDAFQSGCDIGVWPFDGTVEECIQSHEITIVETYPREFYRRAAPQWPMMRQRWSKRRQGDRKCWASSIISWADELEIVWADEVLAMTSEGFGSDSNGEDRFDALIGLLGMIAVAVGALGSGENLYDDSVTTIEGWILGRNWAETLQIA